MVTNKELMRQGNYETKVGPFSIPLVKQIKSFLQSFDKM